MVEANRAYRDGDAELLETLLGLFDAGEDGSDERVELRRVLWQIDRTRRRLAEVASELEDVESSEIFGIWREAELAADQGRDLVAERVASIRRSLAKAQARLEALRSGA
jgi:hypothetical protein